jgi:hypothetical protein
VRGVPLISGSARTESNMIDKRDASDVLKGTLSKSSTIGPPLVWAVPTVGRVIDKEELMHIKRDAV